MKTILLEEIRDYTSLGNLKVDRVGAIVHNVKIIGFQSANDREYTPEALRQAIPMYEGVNVNIDHPDGGPDEQRSAWDRIGFLKNVKFVEGKGLYGDLHLLPSHPFTERILEAAEKMPQIYGLSHNAKGEGFEDKKTKKFVVNKVAEVRHVDLVADPATTHSLAESKEAEVPVEQEAEEGAYTRVGYKSRKRGVGAKRGYTKTKSKLYVSHESQESDGEKSKSSDGEYDKLHARIIDVLKHDGVPDHQKADQIVSLVTNKSSKKEEGRDMAKDETKISKDDDTEEAVSRDDDKDIKTDEPSDSDTEESEGSEECPKCGRKMESCCGEEKDEEDAEESEDGKADEKDDEEEPVSKKKMEKKKMKEKYSSKESKDSRKAIDDVKELCESHKLTADESLIQDLAAVPVSVAEGLIKRLANAERLLKPKSAVKAKEAQKSEIDMLEGKQLFSWLRN